MTDRSDRRRGDAVRVGAVLGPGYVGLPQAVALAETRGSDSDPDRIERLRSGTDLTDAVGGDTVAPPSASSTDQEGALVSADAYFVAVPPPVDRGDVPDLRHVPDAIVFAATHDAFGTQDVDWMHREVNDDPVVVNTTGPSVIQRGPQASPTGGSEAMQRGVTASNVAATRGAAGVATSGWADFDTTGMGEVPAR